MFAETARRTRSTRRARRAVAAQAPAGRADDVARLIDREWAEHGLEPLGPIGRDRLVGDIIHPVGGLERLSERARQAADLLGLPLRLERALTRGIGEARARQFVTGSYRIATGSDLIDVPLEVGPDQVRRITRQAVLAPSLFRITYIDLLSARTGASRPGAGPATRIVSAWALSTTPKPPSSPLTLPLPPGSARPAACRPPSCAVATEAGSYW